MSSDPPSIAGLTLPERGNSLERAADGKGDVAAGKQGPKASEDVSDPAELADLAHHRGDKVCDVELVPVRQRKIHNVLTRMRDERLRGPLGVMRRCMTENIKVKVITRNYKHVRGICTGYILAFDKHWNLALKDVDEVYKNPLPKPIAKKKKRQRKKKEKAAVPDGKELLQDEKLKTTTKVESVADFGIADSPSAEDDVHSGQEPEGIVSASVELLKEERRRILERLQELNSTEKSSSECEDNELEDLRRCSSVAPTKESFSRVSRDERRRSSTASATGSRPSKGSKSWRSEKKKSYEQSGWRSSRTDDSDFSSRGRDLRDAESGKMQKNLCRKKYFAQTQTRAKETSSRHRTRIDPIMAPKNREDCGESQQTWQSWLVRHVNQLFIRGDNVVLVSINET